MASGGIGARLKSLATNAGKNVTQFVSSPQDATSGKSGAMSKFYNVKRRVTENVMESLGKAEITDDSAYVARKNRMLAFEKLITNMRKNFIGYLDATRAMTHASSEIGGCIREAYTGAEASHSSIIESYAASLRALDTGDRTRMDQSFLTDVIEPLDRILFQIGEVLKQTKERDLVKVDFDARLRKIKLLKEKGSAGDPTILPRKEEKLRKTAEILHNMTQQVYRDMDGIEAGKMALLSNVCQAFTATQREFFTTGLHGVTSLPEISPDIVLRDVSGINELSTAPSAWESVLNEGRPGMDSPPHPLPTAPVMKTYGMPAPAAPTGTTGTTASPTPVYIPRGASGKGLTTAGGAGQSGTVASVISVPPRQSTGAAPSFGSQVATAKVLYTYSAVKPDEISLNAGESVTILETHTDGWSRVKNSLGKVGFFPDNYLAQVI